MGKQTLSTIQKKILIGILLGDAHLERGKPLANHSRRWRLKVEQGNVHKVYLEHLFHIFRLFIRAGEIRKREVSIQDRQHTNWCFQTMYDDSFSFYGDQFYQGKKRVPPLVHELFTPRALAYWFMDDGSMKSKQSKGAERKTVVFPPSC